MGSVASTFNKRFINTPMAKQRLFPEPKPGKRDPQKRFDDTASAVFSVTKAELDRREQRWRDDKAETPKQSSR